MSDDTHRDDARRAIDDHLAEIGLIAVRWSLFELTLDNCAILLAKISAEVGHCFVSQVIGPARKIDAYISIARIMGADESFTKELNNFAADTIALSERRNRIIHDTWIFDLGGDDPARLEITARKRLIMEWRTVPTGEIRKFSDGIIKHMKRFTDIHDRLVNSMALRDPA